MHGKRFVTIIALALAGVAFLAVGAQATSYTWTGTTSNAWNIGYVTGRACSFSECLYRPGHNSCCHRYLISQSVLSTTALLGIASGNCSDHRRRHLGINSKWLEHSQRWFVGDAGRYKYRHQADISPLRGLCGMTATRLSTPRDDLYY